MKSEEKSKKKELELDEEIIEKVTELMMKEFRAQRKGISKPILTLRDMENLVTQLSKKVHVSMLSDMLLSEKSKLATQKKTARNARQA